MLPALIKGFGYSDLDIADGGTASGLLEELLLHGEAFPAARKRKLRRQLLAYCGRDTLALVKIHARLRGLVAAGSPRH